MNISRNTDNNGAYASNYNRAFERENEEDTNTPTIVTTSEHANNLNSDPDQNEDHINNAKTSNDLNNSQTSTNNTENTKSVSRDNLPNNNIQNTFLATNNTYENNAFESSQSKEDDSRNKQIK